MIEVDRIDSLSELSRHRDAWDELAGSRCLASSAWLWSWWEAYQAEHKLYVLRVKRDDHTMGFAPWYTEITRSRAHAIKSLGSGKACTDYQTLLARPGEEVEVARAIADWLIENCSVEACAWDHLELESIARDDVAAHALVERFNEHGVNVAQRPATCAWAFDFGATWEEYFQGVKKNIRRKLRKLDRDYVATQKSKLVVLQEGEAIEPWFDRLVELHQARWNHVGVEGCFTTAEFRTFLRKAVTRLHEQQRVWMVGLELEGLLVGVSLFLTDDDTIRLYQVGVDPQRRDDQIGWQLNYLTLQAAFNRGIRRVDFLRGEEDYKRYLGATPVEQWSCRVAAPRSTAKLRHQFWMTTDWFRDWGRQFSRQ